MNAQKPFSRTCVRMAETYHTKAAAAMMQTGFLVRLFSMLLACFSFLLHLIVSVPACCTEACGFAETFALGHCNVGMFVMRCK